MEKIFLGIKGHVVCLNKHSGEEVWRTKLKIDWGKPTIVLYSDDLFVYLSGTLYCLSPDSGDIKWKNGLKGLGSGSCVLAVSGKASDNEVNATTQSVTGELIEAVIDLSS